MKKQFGFTLINLAVTLAVGGVALGVGVPAFMEMVSVNKMAGFSNDLVGAIRLARSEAVKRTGDATICASNLTQTACSTNNWVNGWIVFTDEDGSETIDTDDEIIKVWQVPETDRDGIGVDLEFEATAPPAIRFSGTGVKADSAAVQFSFKETDCTGNRARQITVSAMGRTTLDNVACF
jgi:type IV fimbrial biogenesis protein FimT